MRKGKPQRRPIAPDPKYNDILASKFINKLMLNGKKTKAQAIFYQAMDIIVQKTSQDPIEIFQAAVNNVRPLLEVRPRRVGGATLQVPVEPQPERSLSLSMRWIIGFARKRGEKTMSQRLAAELIAAARGEGASIKKRDDTHRMAEANKAFAHLRF
ncbi:MAG: 30S ribosomal protein S7 [Bacteroidia bacterium]